MNIELWKKRKKELHWTHDDLARESGVGRRTIAGIFSGDPRYESPTFNTIKSIENALGVPPSLEWSSEEKAEGVGNHPTYLNEGETEWIELRSEILRVFGQDYLDALTSSLQKLTEISDKK